MFGKHKGRSYDDVMREDPGFCKWVVQTAAKPDAGEDLKDFGAYVKEHKQWTSGADDSDSASSETYDDNIINFGRHRGREFEQVLEEDPGYCAWVLKNCAKPDAHQGLKAFGDFIRRSGGDVKEHKHRTSGVGDSDSASSETYDGDIINFGRHTGRTFEQVLEEDPEYCAWVLENCKGPDANSCHKAFGNFIRRQFASVAPQGASTTGNSGCDVKEHKQRTSGVGDSDRASSETYDGDIINFGRHTGRTFEQVLEEDPGYCAWVLKNCDGPDANPCLKAFGSFIRPRFASVAPLGASSTGNSGGDASVGSDVKIIGFGRHRGKSYEETMRGDPGWCDWVLRMHENPDSGAAMKMFGAYLKEQTAKLP